MTRRSLRSLRASCIETLSVLERCAGFWLFAEEPTPIIRWCWNLRSTAAEPAVAPG